MRKKGEGGGRGEEKEMGGEKKGGRREGGGGREERRKWGGEKKGGRRGEGGGEGNGG